MRPANPARNRNRRGWEFQKLPKKRGGREGGALSTTPTVSGGLAESGSLSKDKAQSTPR